MIPIVKAEDVMTRRGRGGIEKKYTMAVEKHLDWIKKSIESSKDGTIRMKTMDFAKELGPEFTNRNPAVIQRNLKGILFDKDIIIESGTHKDGDKLLIMRFATKIDKLRGPGIDIEDEDVGDGEKEEGKEEEIQ